jgi:hypothetical protein
MLGMREAGDEQAVGASTCKTCIRWCEGGERVAQGGVIPDVPTACGLSKCHHLANMQRGWCVCDSSGRHYCAHVDGRMFIGTCKGRLRHGLRHLLAMSA